MQVVQGQYPYTVAVVRANRKNFQLNFICTGALVSRIHVLTSAHCIKNESVRFTLIFVGSHDMYRSSSYEVRSWRTYDAWASERQIPNNIEEENDIAIVTVS